MASQETPNPETIQQNYVLYSKIDTFITGGYVIAGISVLFFPVYLLGAILYCACGPSTWGDTSRLPEDTKKLIKKGYSNNTLIASVGFVLWMVLSIFLMFFFVGFLMLALAFLCYGVFMIFVPIPLSELYKKQEPVQQV